MKRVPAKSYSYIIFEKLKQELAEYDFPIGPERARRILIRSVSLFPDVIVEESRKPAHIIIRSIKSPSSFLEISIQSAVDSIMVLWNERMEMKEHSKSSA